MSDYDNLSPTVNAPFNEDGSVTTFDSAEIQAASESGEDLYNSMSPTANKFLNPDGTIHTLAEISGGSGGTLYDGVGQNTDGAMTQKATTNMIYDPATGGIKITDNGMTGISIGDGANAAGDASIAIGTGSNTTNTYPLGIALGVNSNCSGQYSIALGYGATATENNVVSVGGSYVNTRRIVNVSNPTNAQDAATKAYVDSLVPQRVAFTLGTSESSTLCLLENSCTTLGGVLSGKLTILSQGGGASFDENNPVGTFDGITGIPTNTYTSAFTAGSLIGDFNDIELMQDGTLKSINTYGLGIGENQFIEIFFNVTLDS